MRWPPLIPPFTSWWSLCALDSADHAGGQFPIAADHAAILQEHDVLPGHQQVQQLAGRVEGRTTAAQLVATRLGAADLVALDTDDLGAGRELLERGRLHAERAGAVHRRGREDLLDRNHDLLDRGRYSSARLVRQVGGEPPEEQAKDDEQRDADPQWPALDGPEDPVVIVVGIRKRVRNGHRVPRGEECYGTFPSHYTHRFA